MNEELYDKFHNAPIEEIKKMVKDAAMPPEVRQIAEKELESLSHTDREKGGYEESLNYISCLISHPWHDKTEGSRNLDTLVETLNESRLCSQNIREKLLRHLTVKLLKNFKKLKVLVVDDERIAVDSLELTLTKDGYSVETAGSGAEAIEKLSKSDYDLVITDLIMGDLDGQAVIKEVKNKYPDTGVIMITGYATVDTAVEALRSGAFHYIEKPIRLDELRSAVRGALKHRHLAARSNSLCFAGPSGTVKVELCKTIAKALGRHLVRIPLSDVKDESVILGRSRTDGGMKPGCIIENIIRSGSSHPLILLEGIDMKEQNDEIAQALLEILDPSKHKSFTDRYLGVPLDLSSVIFITTAFNSDNIDGRLKDFLDIIEF